MLLKPCVAVGFDPNEGFGCHSCAGAAGGAEAALISKETVPDYGNARDHALAAVLRVGDCDSRHG